VICLLFDLSGKVAIVSGATKGLGYDMALALANAGADIVVVSRTESDCKKVAKEIENLGRKALTNPCDVTNSDSIAQLVQNTINVFGKIDILVNNAGVAFTKPAEDLTEDDWDRVVDTNLKAVFLLSQAVGREMIKQKYGRIINIGSIFGLVGEKSILPYLASKGGVIQITKGLALEWAKYNIQVNCIAPGYVLTPMNEKELSQEKIKNYINSKIPMRRVGLPSEISSAVVYLASDAASYITGSVLCIDGGWLAQ
jgi:NAD(P)-dependent dehydrogenase (short-subunit alcohol dehydrogenase family)